MTVAVGDKSNQSGTVSAKEPGLEVKVDVDLVDDLTERSKTLRRV
jgi:hypothetical protein